MTETMNALPRPGQFIRNGSRPGRIEEMLRVDHAGEYGAVNIYRGQRAVFDALPGKSRMASMIRDMEKGEAHHLETFDRLLVEREIRPTVFAPLWNAAGFTLGAVTALMGEKSAMACTSAVERVIEGHYAEQAAELPESEADLKETIETFREEELEHHDTAIREGAEESFGYGLMKSVIEAVCRTAIKVAEKL